ncbi:MAG: thioredoxin domain-containing protein [Deinococcales bacterium]
MNRAILVLFFYLLISWSLAQNTLPNTPPSEASSQEAAFAEQMTQTQVNMDLRTQPHLGHPGAPVLMLLFEDFSCPHCKRFTEDVLSDLIRDFVLPGYVYIVYINFPIIDKNSFFAAWAGECAFAQNNLAFWRYKRYIFQYQQSSEGWASPDNLVAIARNHVTELNPDELMRCIVEGDYEQEVLHDLAYAESLAIPGTPALVINNNLAQGTNYAYISDMIYLALEEVFESEKQR